MLIRYCSFSLVFTFQNASDIPDFGQVQTQYPLKHVNTLQQLKLIIKPKQLQCVLIIKIKHRFLTVNVLLLSSVYLI